MTFDTDSLQNALAYIFRIQACFIPVTLTVADLSSPWRIYIHQFAQWLLNMSIRKPE